MNIDFEKIRCEVLDNFNSKLDPENNITQIVEQIAYASSIICKDMLSKYHEDLINSKE